MHFPTDYPSILKKLADIDPISYAKTRNFINGKITRLSPYISRGVISTKQIYQHIRHQFPLESSIKLIQELAWRDFYQLVYQSKTNAIFSDLKNPQEDVDNHQIPTAILQASTGIEAIDKELHALFETGYLHNHFRMYTAALACNFGKSHWKMPADWMYYHLLDGDLASNSLSWQWVAATFSSKKYFFNQENLNKYSFSKQSNTFLDIPYEKIPHLPKPLALKNTSEFLPEKLVFPEQKPLNIHPNLPTFLYNSYNLDPIWHAENAGNRILILEPSHFEKYPVSQKVLDFILDLSKNIPNIQVFIGEFAELEKQFPIPFFFKEHPTNLHYKGTEEPRDWLFPEIKGNFQSFFQYWRKAEKFL